MPLPTCQCNNGLPIQQQLANIYCALLEIQGGGDFSNFVTLTGVQTVTNKTLTSPKINQILDANGNEVLILGATPGAVNEVTISNAATGQAPAITATGGNADIGLEIRTKGNGNLDFNSGALLVNGTSGIVFTPNGLNVSGGSLVFSAVGSGADTPAPDGTYANPTSISISNGVIIAIS